jgi:hypothetical protein
MHLGKRRMRRWVPKGLADVGTREACPYRPPVRPASSTASSNTLASRRRIRDPSTYATKNTRTSSQKRSQGRTRRGLSQVATRIIGGQGIITFIIIHNEITISIPSISLYCNLHCHCWFVLEFTQLFIFHSKDYNDVLDCLHVWVVHSVLGGDGETLVVL